MRRFLTLLIAFMGVVGFANAQTPGPEFKTFKADVEELVIDQAAGATTAKFKVSYNEATAKLNEAVAVAKVWNGTGYEETADDESEVRINKNEANDEFSVTFVSGIENVTGTNKHYVIEFSEGAFEANAEKSAKLSIRLVVIPTPTFTAGQTFYLEEGIEEPAFSGENRSNVTVGKVNEDGALVIKVAASESSVYGSFDNNQIVAVNEDMLNEVNTYFSATEGNTATAYAEDGKGYLVIPFDLYKNITAASSDYNISVPVGLFETKFSKSTADAKYILDVKARVKFQPQVYGSYDNKAQTLTFTFANTRETPNRDTSYGSYENGTAGIGQPDWHNMYITLGDDDTQYPVTNYTTRVNRQNVYRYTVNLGDADALNMFAGKDDATFKVHGDFYMNNTHATVSVASVEFSVSQKTLPGLVVVDPIEVMYVSDNTAELGESITINFPEGIALKDGQDIITDGVQLSYGSDDIHAITSIKAVSGEENEYILTFDASTPLTRGNEYILSFPASSIEALGSDNILYYNKDAASMAVSVKHVYTFYDNYVVTEATEETPAVTKTTEWRAVKDAVDSYDIIEYKRNFIGGVIEALCVPFDVVLGETPEETEANYPDFKFLKLYCFTSEGAGTDALHVAQTGKLYANMPYLIIAKEGGNKTLRLQNAQLKEFQTKSIESATTETTYKFTGSKSDYVVEGKNEYAVAKTGKIKLAAVGAKLKPWRWHMTATDKNIQYAKQIEVIIDTEEDAEAIMTGIKNAQLENTSNASMYNVMGQKISSSNGQIYIKNGKKFISK